MDAHDVKRRLLWHGMLIVLLALATGVAVPAFTNPRMGLSAHLGGIMTGVVVALIGAVWQELRLASRTGEVLFWTTIVAGYTNFGGLVLAAIFGTSGMTPIAGAGHAGAPWQELLVDATLVSGAATILAACVFVLRGLGRRS